MAPADSGTPRDETVDATLNVDEECEILRKLSYRRAVAQNIILKELEDPNMAPANPGTPQNETVDAMLKEDEEREMLRKLSYRRAVAQNVLELLIQDVASSVVSCEATATAIRVSHDSDCSEKRLNYC